MKNMDWIGIIGIVGSILMPLFNIPMIVRIIRRKSSQDFSLVGAAGLFSCMLLMLPQALRSEEISFKLLNFISVIVFGILIVSIIRYRSKS